MKCASVLLTLVFASPVFAQETRNTMNVSGECLKSVTQDRAAVTLTADFLDASAATAAKKATQQYATLVERVKKMNLKNAQLETSEYSVQEDFDYTAKSGRRSKGFRARNGLRVETSEIDRMGEVIKIGTELGLRDISALSMSVSPAKWKVERESCLEEAFANALSKAERLAKVSGVKIKGVGRIDESGSSMMPRRPMHMSARMDTMSDSVEAAPQIQSRSEDLQTTVNVMFLLN